MTNNNKKNITTQNKSHSLMQATEKLSNTAHAVNDSAHAITKLSELLNEQDIDFLKEYLSPAGKARLQILERKIQEGGLSTEAAQKLLNDIQKADTDEKVRLMDARSESHRAHGSKVFRVGAGVGAGAIGLGFLAKVLYDIFGNHDNNN